MMTTLHLGRRTLILGWARQDWLGARVVRSSYRGCSSNLARLGGFYAVLTTPRRELVPEADCGCCGRSLTEAETMTHECPEMPRYSDPEQHGG